MQIQIKDIPFLSVEQFISILDAMKEPERLCIQRILPQLYNVQLRG